MADGPGTGNVFVEDEEDERPRKPCEGSRKELIKCLKESDCIKVLNILSHSPIPLSHSPMHKSCSLHAGRKILTCMQILTCIAALNVSPARRIWSGETGHLFVFPRNFIMTIFT